MEYTFVHAYKEYSHMWDKPWRFYHGLSHLVALLDKIVEREVDRNLVILSYFALFHDIFYNAKDSDNEEKSATFFLNESSKFSDLSKEDCDLIVKMILATKDHKAHYHEDGLIGNAVLYDTEILYQSFPELLKYEEGVFKEYQHYSIEQYRAGRVEFLSKFSHLPNVAMLRDYVKNKVYNVGYYAGSFNPFHIGHLDILRKAERLFDKVVLVRATNPDKVDQFRANMPKSLPNEIVTHHGLITSLLKKEVGIEKTMVRGIRNEFDVAAEMNYQSWVEELDPEVKFVHLFCESKNAKISSSMLKSMKSFEDFDMKRYLVE